MPSPLKSPQPSHRCVGSEFTTAFLPRPPRSSQHSDDPGTDQAAASTLGPRQPESHHWSRRSAGSDIRGMERAAPHHHYRMFTLWGRGDKPCDPDVQSLLHSEPCFTSTALSLGTLMHPVRIMMVHLSDPVARGHGQLHKGFGILPGTQQPEKK